MKISKTVKVLVLITLVMWIYGFAGFILERLYHDEIVAGNVPPLYQFTEDGGINITQLNNNFNILRSYINGKIDSTNAPTLFPKTGGIITGHTTIKGAGQVIKESTSNETAESGKFKIVHSNAAIELKSTGADAGIVLKNNSSNYFIENSIPAVKTLVIQNSIDAGIPFNLEVKGTITANNLVLADAGNMYFLNDMILRECAYSGDYSFCTKDQATNKYMEARFAFLPPNVDTSKSILVKWCMMLISGTTDTYMPSFGYAYVPCDVAWAGTYTGIIVSPISLKSNELTCTDVTIPAYTSAYNECLMLVVRDNGSLAGSGTKASSFMMVQYSVTSSGYFR